MTGRDVGVPSVRSWRLFTGVVGSALGLMWRAARWRFVVTGVMQLLTALFLAGQILLGSVALQAMLDADRSSDGARGAILPLVAMAVVSAVVSLSLPLLNLQQRLLGELVQRTTFDRILDVTQAVDLEAFESPDFFERVQRVRSNAAARSMAVTYALLQLVGAATAIAGLTVALYALQPLLLPLLLCAGIPLFAMSRRDGRAEFEFTLRQSTNTRLRLFLQEVLCGRAQAKEVRAYALEAPFRHRYDDLYTEHLDDLRAVVRRRTRGAVMGSGLAALLTTASFVALLLLVQQEWISLAEAGAAALAIRLLSWRIDLAFAALGKLFESAPFLADLEEFLELAPDPGPDVETLPAPVDGFDRLELRGVGFRYPGSTAPVLFDVDLDIARGEVIALVGENGSGKTTLAKVVAGLFRPTAGAVRWDTRDVAGFAAASVRARVAVVFQDFVRYALPARDNIALGSPGDTASVQRAARAAGAHDFLSRLPDGYDTVLSKEYDGGRDLSEGQWQRVALARAFHRDAPMVVLDEPAASLDPRAEDQLFQTVRALLPGRTVLFITHRFSTARSADRILVLERGRVVEDGNHDDLVALGGRYAELFELQAAAYREAPRVPVPR